MRNIIEWTDGLATGVEIIDQDHKKLLLLINQLSEAIDSDSTQDVIGDVMDQLDHYARDHFAREEKLMLQCNYEKLEDHKSKHLSFSQNIVKMKQQILSVGSILSAEKIGLFLVNWLINHIVAEDLLLIPHYSKHNLIDSKNKSIFSDISGAGLREYPFKNKPLRKLSHYLSGNVKLKNRIMISAIIPLFFMFMLSIAIGWNSVAKLRQMNNIKSYLFIMNHVHEYSHSLQAERGLTSGFISSNHLNFSEELYLQREKTDIENSLFIKQLIEIDAHYSKERYQSYIQELLPLLQNTLDIRKKVDEGIISITEMQKSYTGQITKLLKISDEIQAIPMDSSLTSQLHSLAAILRYKEITGLKRAKGTSAIENRSTDLEKLTDFTILVGQERAYIQQFFETANSRYQSLWEEFVQKDEFKDAARLEFSLLEHMKMGRQESLTSDLYWTVLTVKMNQLKLIISEMIGQIELEVEGIRIELQIFISLIILSLIILLTLTTSFSLILNRSITWPIMKLTRAMVQLARGNREIKYSYNMVNDELKQIATAYELCRIGLLQGDWKELERQYSSKVNEHYVEMSNIDPLTKLNNRRQFESLAAIEFDRCKRSSQHLTTLMLDLDNFKQINDLYGHHCGDQVLKRVSVTCAGLLRSTDIIARIGGEEFSVLLYDSDLQIAQETGTRICRAVEELQFNFNDQLIHVTVSIGAAEWENQNSSLSDLLEKADKALYRAKKSGKNQVCCFHDVL